MTTSATPLPFAAENNIILTQEEFDLLRHHLFNKVVTFSDVLDAVRKEVSKKENTLQSGTGADFLRSVVRCLAVDRDYAGAQNAINKCTTADAPVLIWLMKLLDCNYFLHSIDAKVAYMATM